MAELDDTRAHRVNSLRRTWFGVHEIARQARGFLCCNDRQLYDGTIREISKWGEPSRTCFFLGSLDVYVCLTDR